MQIKVPARHGPRLRKVPKAGFYDGTVQSVDYVRIGHEKRFVLEWTFRAEGKSWSVEQQCDRREMAAVLTDLGMGGKTVEHEDAIGKSAKLEIRTYAGRKSMKVVDVLPLDA